jgi:hypothetical protein
MGDSFTLSISMKENRYKESDISVFMIGVILYFYDRKHTEKQSKADKN